MKKKVRYRLEIDYLSRDYEDSCLSTSSPIYTLEEGFRKYFEAVENERCADDKEKPVRAWLWEYHYNRAGELKPKTLARNY